MPTRRAAIDAEKGGDDEKGGWTWRHVGLFTGGLAVALLMFFVVRGVVLPSQQEATSAPDAPPASATFPQATAASVAEDFADAYFTWNAADPDAREASLAGLVQGGVARDLGWNGRGDSSGTDARLVSLRLLGADAALATVSVTVVSTASSSEKDEGERQTIEVPLVADHDRVFVSGLPAAVAVTSPSRAKAQGPAESVDATATDETRASAKAFFTAYGSESDLTGVAASGSGLRGLDGVFRFESLVSWQATEGTGTFHTGYATVRWSTDGGAVLEQRYRVGLAKTGASKLPWQALNLDADYTSEARS